MRFLLDAQLSPRLVRQFEQAGHDASHVFDHLDPAAGDEAVAILANQLSASVVSKDADFAELAHRGITQQTFVWVRAPNMSNDLLWARVDLAMPRIVSAVRAKARIVEVF
ncbi:DUF5615 family PIN-like protein [Devosia sp.]|uniref:DUF5615 family PIN-like protein n=1 Tax=Devosia sp. TaxID=1871048 RepID=UPI003A924CBB